MGGVRKLIATLLSFFLVGCAPSPQLSAPATGEGDFTHLLIEDPIQTSVATVAREHILKERPKSHLPGRIHGSYGVEECDGVRFGNASPCDETYKSGNSIWVLKI